MYQSSVPLLALVGQPPARLDGRGAFQDSSGVGRTVDAARMFSALTKLTRRVDDPARFWDDLEDAVVAALEGRPGPSVLLLPRSSYAAHVPDRAAQLAASVRERARPREARQSDLREALEHLRRARCPVMIVSEGAQRTHRPRALVEFADAIGIPVATTMGARGEFPNDHPNYIGVIGMAGHPSVHELVRDRCDLRFGSDARLWVAKARTREELEACLADFFEEPLRTGVLELVLTVEEIPRSSRSSRAYRRARRGGRHAIPDATASLVTCPGVTPSRRGRARRPLPP